MSSSMLKVYLSSQTAQTPWSAKASYSLNQDKLTLHLRGNDPLRTIQMTAKKCQSLEVDGFMLCGAGWDEAKQWAFYCGVDHPKTAKTLTFEKACGNIEARIGTAKFIKQLINQGPEDCYPETLIAQAKTFLEQASQQISTTVTQGEDLLHEGWIGTYSVGKGSDKDPAIAIFDYNPAGDKQAPVKSVLVGKGVTFDSGGYCIKPRPAMASMKHDMGGAATVIGALHYAIQLGLKERVVVVLCCVENLINGKAFKLGDILTYKNGVTAEILNTDAEGRLILADGLQIADSYQPKTIIDVATLTGAAGIALGDDYSGLFSMDEQLANLLLTFAKQQQEGLWRLPLESWHQEKMPSPYADTANGVTTLGGGPGGASNAAGFLSRFLKNPEEGWAHLDIAPNAFLEHGNSLYAPGATAVMFSTLATHLLA